MDTQSIFLSYSRKDEEFAKRIALLLKKSNVTIWFDQTDIPKGSLWDNEIEKALKKCNTVIFILSNNSVKSNNVLDEISYALEENKNIIPIKINQCETPFRIRRIQYIDFTKKNELSAINELLTALGKVNQEEIADEIIPWYKKFRKTLIFLSILIILCVLMVFFYPQTKKIDIPDITNDAIRNNKIKNIASKDTFKQPNTLDTTTTKPEVKEKLSNSNPESKQLKSQDPEPTPPLKKIEEQKKADVTVDVNNNFIIQRSNKVALSNYKTKVLLINDVFDKITLLSDTRFYSTSINNKVGVYNSQGKLIIPVEYEKIVLPREDYFMAYKTGEGYSYFSINGFKLPVSFFECRVFINGLAAVKCSDGTWGFIDKSGLYAIGCQFEWVGDFDETGVCSVKGYDRDRHDIKYFKINRNGEKVRS